MKRWTLLAFCCLLVIFTMAGCEKKVKETAGKNEHVEKKKPERKQQPFQNVYPLTGIATNHKTDARPIGVMINNHWKARPQSGLHKADIVYEVLAEGGITRFLAIFQSEMPVIVGPVRSARDYFVDLSQGYHSIYVFHGWSPKAKEMLTGGTIDSLNGLKYDGSLFKRVSFRQAPHNSYITYKNIIKGAKQEGFALTDKIKPLPFLKKEEIKGDKAVSVLVTYNRNEKVNYTYHKARNAYVRSSEGEPTIDRETKTPIEANNVFIVEARHHVIDKKGRIGIDLVSGGNALLVQNGVARKIKWQNDRGRIIPVGTGFIPGKTWINIVPADPGLEKIVTIQ
ncbi:DUF3048 domain-containing protein [Fictibacillus gelatini]|uniref:DUF3048 domain-containing protein n=1 Tax=Fictibacillus gelatini TaxID=225985 RepID=UPI000421ADE8|nr:DUF3048 domain-containing protein [Fictibacillus gelatini]